MIDRLSECTGGMLQRTNASTGRFRWISPSADIRSWARSLTRLRYIYGLQNTYDLPWWESGSWNDPGVSRDAESGHGNS